MEVEILDDYDEDHNFDDEEDIILLQGEVSRIIMRITNRGAGDVDQIWLIVDESVSVWVDDGEGTIAKSTNTIFNLV